MLSTGEVRERMFKAEGAGSVKALSESVLDC